VCIARLSQFIACKNIKKDAKDQRNDRYLHIRMWAKKARLKRQETSSENVMAISGTTQDMKA
jgi:hypothetical protein